MTGVFTWILGILLAALLIETIFRMMNRFSKESRELFRWVYIIGIGSVSVYLIVELLKDRKSAWSWQSSASIAGMTIIVIAIIFTILINYKRDK